MGWQTAATRQPCTQEAVYSERTSNKPPLMRSSAHTHRQTDTAIWHPAAACNTCGVLSVLNCVTATEQTAHGAAMTATLCYAYGACTKSTCCCVMHAGCHAATLTIKECTSTASQEAGRGALTAGCCCMCADTAQSFGAAAGALPIPFECLVLFLVVSQQVSNTTPTSPPTTHTCTPVLSHFMFTRGHVRREQVSACCDTAAVLSAQHSTAAVSASTQA